TITATATDQAGLSSSASETVTYAPPAPPVPSPKLTQLGTASGAKGKVRFTLACQGAAGTTCHVQVTLSTVEKTHGKKILAVSAKSKTHSKTVTVATLTLTLAAGERLKVSLSLNATGRKLLAHFRKLPAHLSVTLVNGASRTTIISQNLIVRPVPKKHRR
ncbi:MAG: hypothetical protein ABSB69_12525, partial [Solirubrobacteraceae bacterium]